MLFRELPLRCFLLPAASLPRGQKEKGRPCRKISEDVAMEYGKGGYNHIIRAQYRYQWEVSRILSG
jgi:hypothetical protein